MASIKLIACGPFLVSPPQPKGINALDQKDPAIGVKCKAMKNPHAVGRDAIGAAVASGDLVAWAVQNAHSRGKRSNLRVGTVMVISPPHVVVMPVGMSRFRRGGRTLLLAEIVKVAASRDQLEKAMTQRA